MNISSALKKAWKEAKGMITEAKNVVVAHFDRYNERRYGIPWVCVMTENGRFDFSHEVGTYTEKPGREGDLIVFRPVIGQVYGWGQKDYRGGKKTEKNFCKWNGTAFVGCDKLGKEKE